MNGSMQNYVQCIKQFKYKTKLATQMREAKSWWTEYGFNAGVDFNPLTFEQVRIKGNREVKREITNYEISVDIGM